MNRESIEIVKKHYDADPRMEWEHLFSQEGFLAPNKVELMKRDPAEIAQWVALAKQLIEVPELLSWGEHIMYIGQKRG